MTKREHVHNHKHQSSATRANRRNDTDGIRLIRITRGGFDTQHAYEAKNLTNATVASSFQGKETRTFAFTEVCPYFGHLVHVIQVYRFYVVGQDTGEWRMTEERVAA